MQIGKDHLYMLAENGPLVDWLCQVESAEYDFKTGCRFARFRVTDNLVALLNSTTGQELLAKTKVVWTNKAVFMPG